MYAVLPKKSKPSRSVSKDETRTKLVVGWLRRTDKCATGWELVTTDSYQIARIPLATFVGGHDLAEGPICANALKAIEKTGAFTANETVTVVDPETGAVAGPTFERPKGLGDLPTDPDKLEPDHQRPIVMRFSAELLWKLANAMGNPTAPRAWIELEIDPSNATVIPNSNAQQYLKPFVVRSSDDARGLLMPIRRI